MLMRTLGIVIIVTFGVIFLFGLPGMTQDIRPKGPGEWSLRNWIGFFVQITLFILAVIGIYKLGTSIEKDDNNRNDR